MSRRMRKFEHPKNITIQDCFGGFLSEKILQGKSKATYLNYMKTYDKWSNDIGLDVDNSPADSLHRSLVYEWVAFLQKDGLKVSSINHYLRDLRVFLYWCQKEQYCEVFDIELLPEQEQEPKYYSDEDVARLLVKPNMDNFVEVRTWVIVNLVCATGLRRGSICELRMSDINLEDKLIVPSHTKNKKLLRLPISSALYPVLKQFKDDWRYDTEDDDYFFCGAYGGKMTENALRLSYERYCMARGVEKTSIHALRHTFSRNAVLEGISPFELKAILGHSDIKMSSHYVAIWGEDLAPTYDKYSLLDTMKPSRSRSVVKKAKNRPSERR